MTKIAHVVDRLKEVSTDRLSHMSLNFLLNGNDTGCVLVANELSRRLHVALGDKCPKCASANVGVGGDYGKCHDCGEVYRVDSMDGSLDE